MPVLNTLHSPVNRIREEAASSPDINSLIAEITFSILKEQPGLVAEVANGKAAPLLLEREIIKSIDRNRYYFGLDRDFIRKKAMDFMFGYGELQDYVMDEGISDIDGTRFNEFTVKRNGVRERINIDFGSEKVFENYCKIIAVRNGGILNENDSHCRVTDEKRRMRINISIRPRNISGPAICIRKHRIKSYTLKDLMELSMIDSKLVRLVNSNEFSNKTTIICGRGAAGKTTLLRAIVNELPEMERVLIVESDAEVFPDKPYCIEQRIKKENEGGRKITLRDLLKDGLTMTMDTFCVGEITGDEAWEFVKASFTGHRGLATLHAESAYTALDRLLTLCKGAGIDESEATVREICAKSINLIIYIENFKVKEILEVKGFDINQGMFGYSLL